MAAATLTRMLVFSRHRWPRALRAGLFVLLALSLIAQPMLSALGEMHELLAHAGSGGRHAEHSLPHAPASLSQADRHDAGSPLHALLHSAHCCGQVVGLTGIESSVASVRWPPAQPDDALLHAFVGTRLATPFRPPIPA